MLIRLLLLAVIAYFVWRTVRRFFQATQPPRRNDQQRRAAMSIDDMAKCPVCQIYVASSAPGCGRQDCPRRG